MKNKLIVGITLGDVSGIGPEIIGKMLDREKITKMCIPLIIGSKEPFEQGLNIAKAKIKYKTIKEVKDLKENTIYLLDLDNIRTRDYVFGKPQANCGRVVGEYIQMGINLALAKKVDAVVTCPIHKLAFHKGGWSKYQGHTEMFADLTGTKNYSMMLAYKNLRVFHVTTHVSLKEAIRLVKKKRVLEVIKLADKTCKQLGIKNPIIAVSGLNPHASDGGLFGKEEKKEITPAIKEAQKLGINVEGAIPDDTIFCKVKGGQYDAVVCMTHSQGHIATKVLSFNYDHKNKAWSTRGINVTIGLPFPRVSTDHGPAMKKAGEGRASYLSLYDALKYSILLARGKKNG